MALFPQISRRALQKLLDKKGCIIFPAVPMEKLGSASGFCFLNAYIMVDRVNHPLGIPICFDGLQKLIDLRPG